MFLHTCLHSFLKFYAYQWSIYRYSQKKFSLACIQSGEHACKWTWKAAHPVFDHPVPITRILLQVPVGADDDLSFPCLEPVQHNLDYGLSRDEDQAFVAATHAGAAASGENEERNRLIINGIV